ncbi:MAG: Endolytic murein transglycosylase, partial [Patescibacteria group bacterium]|nr:Endolytic murein transglycosylase [Patescibacteria group bacterium]
KVIAGDYLLTEKEGTFSLARRLVNGKFGIDTIKITIPEGWNIFQIAEYLEKNLVLFNKKQFLELAKSKEGYLFPDTYFVSGAINPAEVIKMLQDNYIKKITSLEKEILASGRTEKEIITMASILEGEALPKDRNTVAGILWRRLEIGMPLQVDSTFSYINGKNTYELTLDDLKIDSLYNTYKYKGLPPGPINNPGIEAIKSALNPIKTKYLYFLTEKDGTIHYAKTFEEHKKNKELYL